MAVIFCDTDCELWYTRAREMKLEVIRMPYIIDGKEDYSDLGEEFDAGAFYAKMRAGASASTAGLNEENYYKIFKPFFEKGDDILYIAFSSNMSGTFEHLDNAIEKLKAEHPNVKYRRFDTLNICMGAGLLVYLGAKYCREHGDDIDAACDYLSSIVGKVGLYFVVEDMKYLARGGRISPAKAKLGNIMNIKPVLVANAEGKIDVGSKQQGLKKAYNYIINELKEKFDEKSGAAITIVDADNQEAADMIEARAKELFPNAEIWRQPIGPVIGVHAGPGATGIIFLKK